TQIPNNPSDQKKKLSIFSAFLSWMRGHHNLFLFPFGCSSKSTSPKCPPLPCTSPQGHFAGIDNVKMLQKESTIVFKRNKQLNTHAQDTLTQTLTHTLSNTLTQRHKRTLTCEK